MANTKQAKKRVRQADKRRQHNMGQRSEMRTYIKNTRNAIEAGDKDAAEVAFKHAVSALDRLANRGLIHKNKAARTKSRLSKQVKVIAA